jgi:thioredoxin-like negative regulator of GroEL
MGDNRGVIALRGLLALMALAACAWFGLGVVQARDTSQAQSILGAQPSLGPAEARHVTSLLWGASTLNPDRDVSILRAKLDLLEGRRAAATAVMRKVVGSEPDNIEAWVQMAQTDHTPAGLERAIRNLARLDPRLAQRRS